MNHELGREVALHQAFVEKLDDCKDALHELSDMQEYRRLKDAIDEYIDSKSEAGEIPHDPLKFYTQEIVETEILLLRISDEINRVNGVERDLSKRLLEVGHEGIKAISRRVSSITIENALKQVVGEIEKVGLKQSGFEGELAETVWERSGGDLRVYDEILKLCKIKSAIICNTVASQFQADSEGLGSAPALLGFSSDRQGGEPARVGSGTVKLLEMGGNKISVIKAVRILSPEIGLAEAKSLVENLPAKVCELRNVAPDQLRDARQLFDSAGARISIEGEVSNYSLDPKLAYIFGKGETHVEVWGLLHQKKELFKNLSAEAAKQSSVLSDASSELERLDYKKARRLLEEEIRKVYADFDYEGFESQVARIEERVGLIDARFTQFKQGLISMTGRKNSNPDQASRDRVKYFEEVNSWKAWIESDYRNLFSEYPKSEAFIESRKRLERYEKEARLLIEEAIPKIDIRLLKGERDNFYTVLEGFLGERMKWPWQVKKVLRKYHESKKKWEEEVVVPIRSYFADQPKSDNSEEAQKFLSKTLDECDGKFSDCLTQLSANLNRTRLKLWGGLAAIIAMLATAAWFGNEHLRSLNVVNINVIGESNSTLPDYSLIINGNTYRHGQVVPVGNLSVTVKAVGYDEQTLEKKLTLGKALELGEIQLRRATGYISISSSHPVNCEFFLESGSSSAPEIRSIVGESSQVQLSTGSWEVLAAITNKITSRVWKKTYSIAVAKGETAELQIKFEVGSFIVNANPEGARIFLNNQLIGTNHVTVADVEPGEYELSLKIDDVFSGGTEVITRKMEVQSGRESVISESFEVANCRIESEPPGAMIFFGDIKIGLTPRSMNTFSQKQYDFRLQYPDVFAELLGKKDQWIERNVSIGFVKGESKTHTEDFGLVDMKFDSKPSGAIVFYGENKIGKTPMSIKMMSSEKREFTLKHKNVIADLVGEKDKWIERDVTIDFVKGEGRTHNEDFGLVDMELDSKPSGAIVFYGDNQIGKTPMSIKMINPEKHVFTLKYKNVIATLLGEKEKWIGKDVPIDFVRGKNISHTENLGLVDFRLDSKPQGALVFYKKKKIGETPLMIRDMLPEEYIFSLKYPDAISEVLGHKGQLIERSVVAKLRENPSRSVDFGLVDLSLGSNPPGATIEIYDPLKKGFSPIKKGTPITFKNVDPREYKVVFAIEDSLASLIKKEKVWWSVTNKVNVASGKPAQINCEFKESSTLLDSVPVGVDIIIGGQKFGKTPLKMDGLKPGKVPVVFRIKDEFGIKTKTGNWYSKTNQLALVPGKSTEIKEEFKFGTIRLSSEPKGAEVICNEVSLGVCPIEIGKLVPREYEFVFRYKMMPPQTDYLITKKFPVRQSGISTGEATFQFATIKLDTEPRGLKINWNGLAVKAPFQSFRIKPGVHVFNIESGISKNTNTISVKAGDVIGKIIKFNSKINIVTLPKGAKVFFGGRQVGVTPYIENNLFSSNYAFTLSRQGFRDVDCRVITSPNKISKCELPLVPEGAGAFRERKLRDVYRDHLGMPEDFENTISDGLSWLNGKKHKRGYWYTREGFLRNPRDTAATSLVLLALSNQGYKYNGKRPNDMVLTKGVTGIIDNAKRSGCLDSDGKLVGHALASILLANLFRDNNVGPIKAALEKALAYSVNQQNVNGTWGNPGPELEYNSTFVLLSYLETGDLGINGNIFQDSKKRLENFFAKGPGREVFVKGFVELLVVMSGKRGGNVPRQGAVEQLLAKSLERIANKDEDGELADLFIMAQIFKFLGHKQKAGVLPYLSKLINSRIIRGLDEIKKSGYWALKGKWFPKSINHELFNNVIPVIVLQSYFQGSSNVEPIVVEFGD